MSQQRKHRLTPEEVLDAIEDADAADEAGRILALSDDDLDRELQEAGLDPDAVRARGRTIGERAMRAVGERSADGDAWVTAAPPARRRSVAPRWSVLLAAALAAVVVGGATPIVARLLSNRDDGPTQNRPDASPTATAAPSPRHIRERALEACDQQRWGECLNGLDEARALDPAGDTEPRIQAARRHATEGLRDLELKRWGPDKPRSPSR
jgi:hypothetical protein